MSGSRGKNYSNGQKADNNPNEETRRPTRESQKGRTIAEFCERNQEGRDVFYSVLQEGNIKHRMIQ